MIMKKSIYSVAKALIILFLLAFVLHIVASVLFDWPITLSFSSEIISDNDNVESFLNKKMSLLNTNFEYIGYSTDDIDLPDTPMSFSWYTSSLPSYFSLGTDSYILCLVHFDSDKNQFDYVNTYIGSSKAIDSVTRRYSYSFHRIN